MSKYVKYISSEHFGAPELKGDRWGYCVELLRTCLVTGFNERTDLVEFEVLTPETVKYTFTDNHNYTENQTIKISGTAFQELNDDSFIISTTPKEVIIKSYNNLTGLVGQTNSVTAKAIVAPLGFIEKFKDGNRSVFTTDEDEAFFYIDDTQPDNWSATSNAYAIAPIVYMSDNIIDIDTDKGKCIFPYNTANPTWHKLRSYSEGTRLRNGIMNFSTYPASTVANKTKKLEYQIVGNGRLFYLMINVDNTIYSQEIINIYAWGKYNTTNKLKNNLPYILHANSCAVINTDVGVYSSIKYSAYKTLTNINELSSDYMIVKNNNVAYRYTAGILSCENETAPVFYTPLKGLFNNSITDYAVSGNPRTEMQYPDIYTRKYYITKININNLKGIIGTLPGLMWVYNGSANIRNNSVSKYKFNSKEKYLYNIITSYDYSATGSSSRVIQTIYNISLDYNDWSNYD